MTITFKPEFQQFVDEQFKAGQFASPEDVVEAGLGRLRAATLGDFQPVVVIRRTEKEKLTLDVTPRTRREAA